MFKDGNVLRTLYLNKRLSPGAIARQLSSSKQSVRKYLRLHQIPLRSEDRMRTYKQRFGVHAPHQDKATRISVREQDAIKLMQKLRQNGLSYEKIAGVLNEMNMKTKRGKGKWYAFSVFKIIRRINSENSELLDS